LYFEIKIATLLNQLQYLPTLTSFVFGGNRLMIEVLGGNEGLTRLFTIPLLCDLALVQMEVAALLGKYLL
jgi:hypothetical protein